jgi:RNA polymerase sigma-70 factor (ECF subfamily)
MSTFANLAALYSTPFAMGSTRDVSRSDPVANAFDQFFVSVERKAFKMAQVALRNEDDALDAVQDAMLAMVKSYAERPAEEWKPLFYRILQNRVRDMQRRRSVRGRLMAWLPAGNEDDNAVFDPLDQAPSLDLQPVGRLEVDEAIGALQLALEELPERQRQAFMLRNFEDLDVAQTALAMGCSDGSVKTHYFRALQVLRTKLGDYWS